eukprot:345460-Prymnesium_polylepis.1
MSSESPGSSVGRPAPSSSPQAVHRLRPPVRATSTGSSCSTGPLHCLRSCGLALKPSPPAGATALRAALPSRRVAA